MKVQETSRKFIFGFLTIFFALIALVELKILDFNIDAYAVNYFLIGASVFILIETKVIGAIKSPQDKSVMTWVSILIALLGFISSAIPLVFKSVHLPFFATIRGLVASAVTIIFVVCLFTKEK